MTNTLIFTTTPVVTFCSNTFINVPTILKFDETPLISVVKEEALGYTTEIPIFHADGTYLAKVRGTRVYATEQGKDAGVVVRKLPQLWVCEVKGRTVFEIYQQPGDAFRTKAELYTSTGYFVKVGDAPLPDLINAAGNALQVRGITMAGNVFQNLSTGVWVRSDGSVSIGGF
jgi:hypothetical protein